MAEKNSVENCDIKRVIITAEEEMARRRELAAIRAELQALASEDDVIRRRVYESKQKKLSLAQRIEELIKG